MLTHRRAVKLIIFCDASMSSSFCEIKKLCTHSKTKEKYKEKGMEKERKGGREGNLT